MRAGRFVSDGLHIFDGRFNTVSRDRNGDSGVVGVKIFEKKLAKGKAISNL